MIFPEVLLFLDLFLNVVDEKKHSSATVSSYSLWETIRFQLNGLLGGGGVCVAQILSDLYPNTERVTCLPTLLLCHLAQ